MARNWMFAFVAIGCLTACQSAAMGDLPILKALEEAAMTSCDGPVGRLVRYANEIDKLDGEELSNAQQRATDRFISKPLFTNRMKLALVLAHPNAEPGQRDRGVELLRGALATDFAATSSEKAFARFLYTWLASRAEQASPELESTRKNNAKLKNRQNQLQEQLRRPRRPRRLFWKSSRTANPRVAAQGRATRKANPRVAARGRATRKANPRVAARGAQATRRDHPGTRGFG